MKTKTHQTRNIIFAIAGCLILQFAAKAQTNPIPMIAQPNGKTLNIISNNGDGDGNINIIMDGAVTIGGYGGCSGYINLFGNHCVDDPVRIGFGYDDGIDLSEGILFLSHYRLMAAQSKIST